NSTRRATAATATTTRKINKRFIRDSSKGLTKAVSRLGPAMAPTGFRGPERDHQPTARSRPCAQGLNAPVSKDRTNCNIRLWTRYDSANWDRRPGVRGQSRVSCRKALGSKSTNRAEIAPASDDRGAEEVEEAEADTDNGDAARFFSPVYGASRGAVIGPPFTAGNRDAI